MIRSNHRIIKNTKIKKLKIKNIISENEKENNEIKLDYIQSILLLQFLIKK